jgi:DNA-binding MarR family transcriptional regulator
MADIKCNLCKIRDLYRSIVEFENHISTSYGLSLNEAMLLCCLSDKEKLASTEISEALGLSCSNTSKVIKSVENAKLIKRSMGTTDKRSMLFRLTPKGIKKLEEMDICAQELPENLKKYLSTHDDMVPHGE